MAGERYVQEATVALIGAIRAGIETQLQAVETAQSLSVGTIPRPDLITKSRARGINQPLTIRVFADDADFIQQRNTLLAVGCSILVAYTSDTDMEAAELVMERYVDAISRVIEADPTLSGNATAALFGSLTMAGTGSEQSETRHVFNWDIEVRVHTR